MPALVSWAFIDLDSVKTYLGIAAANTDYDELLEQLINSASGFIESYTDRRLKTTTYDSSETTDIKNTWYDGDASKRLFLRQYPVTAVSSVVDAGATISAASSTDYYGSTGYLLYYLRGELFYDNGWDFGKQSIRVDYTAGYLATDREWYELQDLCRAMVAWVYNSREHLGFKSERLMNYQYTLADMYGKNGPGTYIMRILNRYRRKIFA